MEDVKEIVICQNCSKKYKITPSDKLRVLKCKACGGEIRIEPKNQPKYNNNNSSVAKNDLPELGISKYLIYVLLIFVVWTIWSIIQLKLDSQKFKHLDNKINAQYKDNKSQQTEIDSLHARLWRVQLEQYLDNISDVEGSVDLSNSSIQDIGNGFYIVDLNAEEHLTGLKISGRIINFTSVKHKSIDFKVFCAGEEKAFFVSQISPGNSTAFNIYIPDIPKDKSRYARFKYIESTVNFYK